ncbi:helix-turn-helix domain-containing protein [Serratia liquefaciens]|uniref:helix-turn-helix domain-containing protein n=1 Tax=Serratia liquefaciens TaxID=614 RepID=UPI0021588955|nr:helix-turn-helix transcriptional regulator [Serratia liquefaciens]
MSTLKELMAARSPESRARIEARADELRREIVLGKLREELSMSQTEVARLMGVAQPTVAKMENEDNDPRLSTIKRYVTALGGDISIDITLPTGKRVAYHI